MEEKQQEDAQQGEKLSSDIIAFCTLVARIMMRCLREQKAHAMKGLSSPAEPGGRDPGGTPGAVGVPVQGKE